MIVDGGLGAELAQRGFRFSTKLWSGEAVLTQPALLTEIYRDYLAAGANVIETATYQLSHKGLRELGFDDAAIDAVFARAVQLARDAIAAHRAHHGATGRAILGASLGPYGATLGDGSEYSGTQHLGRDALYAFHAERVRALRRAAPDFFMFETIPTRAEALVVAEVARDLALCGVWLSLSCVDGTSTYGGDRVADIAAELDAFAGIEVLGVNCTAPDAISPLVRVIRSNCDKAIVVCPNLGQRWETDAHALAGGTTEADFLRRVPDWLDLGVMHIGGCCGVGPATIGALAELVRSARKAPIE